MAQRATLTKLAVGQVEIDVALYRTTGNDQDAAEYETAGPNGGKLRHVMRGVEKPAEADPEASDPIAGDPGPDDRFDIDMSAAARGEFSDGEGVGHLSRSPEADVKRVLVEEVEGKPEAEWPEVTPDAIRRGIRKGDGKFIDLTQQLADIDKRTKLEEMRVLGFMDVGQVPRERILGSYYVGVNDSDGAHFLSALRTEMAAQRRVAVVKWTKVKGQSLGVLMSHGKTKTVQVVEVEWADHVHEPHEKAQAVSLAEPDAALGELIGELVSEMHARRDVLDEQRDDRTQLTAELMEAVEAGKVEVFAVPEREPEAGESLLDKLRQSVKAA